MRIFGLIQMILGFVGAVYSVLVYAEILPASGWYVAVMLLIVTCGFGSYFKSQYDRGSADRSVSKNA